MGLGWMRVGGCEVLRVEGMSADGEIHDGGVLAGREGWGIGRGFGGFCGLVVGWFGVGAVRAAVNRRRWVFGGATRDRPGTGRAFSQCLDCPAL